MYSKAVMRSIIVLCFSSILVVGLFGCTAPIKKYAYSPADDSGSAKLTIKSITEGRYVTFKISRTRTSDSTLDDYDCDDFEYLGRTADFRRAKFELGAKIAKTILSLRPGGLDPDTFEVVIPSDREIFITGNGTIKYDFAHYTCGPLSHSFTPIKDKDYLVEFIWENGKCDMDIYEVNKDGSRLPAGKSAFVFCK